MIANQTEYLVTKTALMFLKQLRDEVKAQNQAAKSPEFKSLQIDQRTLEDMDILINAEEAGIESEIQVLENQIKEYEDEKQKAK